MKNPLKTFCLAVILLIVIVPMRGRAQTPHSITPDFSDSVMFEINDIQWKRSPFRMQINNEIGDSVKFLLEEIGRLNGIQIIVNASVSDIHFGDIQFDTLQDAFEYFINSYDLIYYMNDGRIFVEKKTQDKYKTVLLKIQNIDYNTLMQTLNSYDERLRLFKNIELHYDPKNQAVILRGSSTELEDITKLIQDLDSKNNDMMIEKIPLKYAHVGEYSRSVLGREIQVKGIQDTLKAIFDAQFAEDKKDGVSTSSSTLQNLFVDARTNSVILVGPPSHVQKMKQIITMLDTPAKLIQIQVRFFETSHEFLRDVGTKMGFLDASGNLLTNNTTHSNFEVGQPTSETERVGVFHGTFDFFSDSQAVDTILSAWEAEAKGRVLASPSIITTENMEALIEGGETINVKVQSSTTNALGETQLEVKEIHTGIILRVTPHVVDENPHNQRISMQIFAESSQPNFTRTTDDIPVVLRSTVMTQVYVPDGKPAIIGGLSSGLIRNTNNRIPLLSDIPIIGKVFSRSSKEQQYKKVLIFITPSIVGESIPDNISKEHQLQFQKNNEFFQKLDRKLDADVRPELLDPQRDEDREAQTLQENIRNNFELRSSIMALQRLYHEKDGTDNSAQRFINSCHNLDFTRYATSGNKSDMMDVVLEWMRLCDDPAWRLEALAALKSIDPDLAMIKIAGAYEHDDGGVTRELAVAFLDTADSAISFNTLRGVLDTHPCPLVRTHVVKVAARRQGMGKDDILLAAMNDAEKDVQLAALKEMQNSSEDHMVNGMGLGLISDNTDVRRAAMFALASAETTLSFDIILNHLPQEKDKSLSVYAIKLMGANKVLAAIESLEALGLHPSHMISLAAVEALAQINTQPACFALLRIVPKTPFQDVRLLAIKAIGASGQSQLANLLLDLKKSLRDRETITALGAAATRLKK